VPDAVGGRRARVDLADSPVRYHDQKLEGCPRGKVKPSSEQETDIPAKILTVGQAATRAGLTAKAVRLYEARGLLPPAERTSSGYRCYTEHDIQLLRFIRQARELGLSLAEIRAIIGLRRGETPPGREVITVLQARLDTIDHKISSLQHLREAMTGVLHAAAAHADQDDLVPLCQIIDPSKPAPAAATR
jgi:MerR family transcriptional regulator, copper efflux regulator